MSVHHLRAVFHQTVFLRPNGGKFQSTKSSTISLESIALDTELVLDVGSKCEIEISMLKSTSSAPIKLSGKVKQQLSTGLLIEFDELDEVDLERIESIIMHNTSHPYEFEEEIHEMKEHSDVDEVTFLPKAN